jgi:hypothetical protein
MFSLKSPSLLDFKQQTRSEQNNLRSIYLIEGEIPCDNQMRVILDDLEAKEIRPIFASIFQLLNRAGVIKEYRYWDQKVIISIDGVEHFSSQKVHCPSCTSKTLRNGAHLVSAQRIRSRNRPSGETGSVSNRV